MCVIMLKPPAQHLPKRYLREGFRVNGDGAGFMFNRDGRVKIYKGFFGFRAFYRALREAEDMNPDSCFVVHMRIATSGQTDGLNCHPFRVTPQMGFVHNGVMRGLGNKERSDTKVFAEDVLQKLSPDFPESPAIMDAVEECAIASGSKFVLLFGDGDWSIMNERAGHWEGECWYSNYSYVPVRRHFGTGYCGYSSVGSLRRTYGAANRVNTTPPRVGIKSHYMKCETCDRWLPSKDIVIRRWALRICDRCAAAMYLSVQIPCPTCGLLSAFSPEMVTALEEDSIYAEVNCEHCQEEISAENIAWYLLRMHDKQCPPARGGIS
jgi:hypothetical protein